MLEIPLNTLTEHDPRCTVFNTCNKRLYHYTTIKTLASIFENKTIRFTRLDKVNDPREAISHEYSLAQTLVFASCWTNHREESIPLWKMYTDFSGVRLSLPTLMFSGRHNNHKVTNDDRLYEIIFDDFCKIERDNGGLSMYTNRVLGPTRIRYIDNEELLPTNNVNLGTSKAKYDLRILGTQKLKQWEYEHEVRFRLLASAGYSFDENGENWISPESFVNLPVKTEYVDVPLDNTILNEMEITLGPKCSRSEYALVESLCNHYAPNSKMNLSLIQIR